MELKRLRLAIDRLDDRIVGLLEARARLASRAGSLKGREGRPILAPDRERAIFERLSRRSSRVLEPADLQAVFREIIYACRSKQKAFTIAYLGPEATSTHHAALRSFGPSARYLPFRSISEVFEAVEKERADYGALPLETSLEGIVQETVDLLALSGLRIAAEHVEEISHHLLSASGDSKRISDLYAHPQALAQCRRWLERNLPQVSLHPMGSTAEAATQASLDSKAAAIAPLFARELYHLRVAASRIEDEAHHLARVVLIGRENPPRTGADKTSLIFSIDNKPGALCDALGPFKALRLNITNIESRPGRNKPWEYFFFLEFFGHQDDSPVRKALQRLKKQATFLKTLGSYPRAGKP